jgi:hypothetical protein
MTDQENNTSHRVFTTKIHWGALLQISGVFEFEFVLKLMFEFEFAFEFGTYILHIPWSQSQTNDLSTSVRTFFKKRTPFHLPLSPCKRASYHTHFVVIIFPLLRMMEMPPYVR